MSVFLSPEYLNFLDPALLSLYLTLAGNRGTTRRPCGYLPDLVTFGTGRRLIIQLRVRGGNEKKSNFHYRWGIHYTDARPE